jgi:hypothetical protein
VEIQDRHLLLRCASPIRAPSKTMGGAARSPECSFLAMPAASMTVRRLARAIRNAPSANVAFSSIRSAFAGRQRASIVTRGGIRTSAALTPGFPIVTLVSTEAPSIRVCVQRERSATSKNRYAAAVVRFGPGAYVMRASRIRTAPRARSAFPGICIPRPLQAIAACPLTARAIATVSKPPAGRASTTRRFRCRTDPPSSSRIPAARIRVDDAMPCFAMSSALGASSHASMPMKNDCDAGETV